MCVGGCMCVGEGECTLHCLVLKLLFGGEVIVLNK